MIHSEAPSPAPFRPLGGLANYPVQTALWTCIRGRHPDPARIESALVAIGFDDENGLVRVVEAAQVGLTTLVDTPQGRRTLTASTA